MFLKKGRSRIFVEDDFLWGEIKKLEVFYGDLYMLLLLEAGTVVGCGVSVALVARIRRRVARGVIPSESDAENLTTLVAITGLLVFVLGVFAEGVVQSEVFLFLGGILALGAIILGFCGPEVLVRCIAPEKKRYSEGKEETVVPPTPADHV